MLVLRSIFTIEPLFGVFPGAKTLQRRFPVVPRAFNCLKREPLDSLAFAGSQASGSALLPFFGVPLLKVKVLVTHILRNRTIC